MDQSSIAAHPKAPPDRPRIGSLDAARGWAIVGVIMVHGLGTVDGPESGPGLPAAALTGTTNVLFEAASRSLLAMLLGIGIVLAWDAAVRRHVSPAWFTVRRYAVLFAVIGLPHWYFFETDILTHYALIVLALVPALPWLLGGARWRPLALAAACPPLQGVMAAFFPTLPAHLPFQLVMALWTLMALAIGIWIARGPELAGSRVESAEAAAVRAPALRLCGWGLAGIAAGAASTAFGALVLAPALPDGDPSALSTGAMTTAMAFGAMALAIGRGLVYFGGIRWLAERGRAAAGALGVLAPIGRMSLTAYLGSTAVFLSVNALLALAGDGDGLGTAARFGVGAGYLAAVALLCPLWLRSFGHGPVEWLWRRLTYLRPLPFRRPAAPDAAPRT